MYKEQQRRAKSKSPLTINGTARKSWIPKPFNGRKFPFHVDPDQNDDAIHFGRNIHDAKDQTEPEQNLVDD